MMIVLVALLAVNCGDGAKEMDGSAEQTSAPNPPASSASSPAPAAAPDKNTAETLAVWVNRLSVRDQPNTDGKRLAVIEKGMRVTPTGKTGKQDAYLLSHAYVPGKWLEITTPDGVTGWTFGGGLIPEGARAPGYPYDPAKRINFPNFADIDLTTWQQVSREEGMDAGDFDGTETVYEDIDQRLTILELEGEYGYSVYHTLTNLNGDKLRERHLQFSNGELTLTETVTDYTGAEETVYTRSQRMDVPYQRMEGRPVMVVGSWE